MNYWKALISGFVSALVMFVFMMIGIHVTGIAPFNNPPSAAMLISLGLPAKSLALVAHFGYGIFWALASLWFFGRSSTIGKNIGLATGLWTFMMLVHSPLIGWGIFGVNAGTLSPDNPLYLESSIKYIVATFVLHLIYGLIVGWMNTVWAIEGEQVFDETQPAVE